MSNFWLHLMQGKNQRDEKSANANSSEENVHDIDQQLKKARAAWLGQLENFKNSFGCIELPPTPMLTEKHLANCQVLPYREAILHKMKAGAVAAEVGVQAGWFSQSILDKCKPSKLHLIDLDLKSFSIPQKFEREINEGIVQLHEGDSSSILHEFTDGYFDFIYVDADHSYEGVKRDIRAAKSKINEEGFLIFNDYTYWSPAECMRYGVIQAVNELCIEEDWEMVYFALAPYMYCDVVLKKYR
jgi:hypothetical protein